MSREEYLPKISIVRFINGKTIPTTVRFLYGLTGIVFA